MSIFKDFATVECLTCSKMIAATAPLCPHCGRHRDKKEQDLKYGISLMTGQNKITQDDIVVLKVIFGGLMILGSGLSLLFDPFDSIESVLIRGGIFLVGVWLIKSLFKKEN